MLRSFLCLLVLAALTAAPSLAQGIALGDEVTLVINGTVQPRVSFGAQEGDERLGVGLRRARLQTRTTYQDRIGLEFDFDGSSGDLRSVDLFGFYNLTDNLQLRAGRQPGAQPRSYVPTSHSRIDVIERAAIAERWAQGTIGSSGRDFGLDLEFETDQTTAVLFVHSGTGEFSRAVGNFRESVTSGSVVRGTDETGVAVTAMAQHEPAGLPGVEIGAFAGVNPVGSESSALGEIDRGYTTGGAHVYWGARPGSQPVRLKLDALGVRYDEVDGARQESVGVSALGAVRVLETGEAFARAERFWSDVDGSADDYLAAGLSYSLSAAQGHDYRKARLTLAYHFRSSEVDENAHLVVLQGQFAF